MGHEPINPAALTAQQLAQMLQVKPEVVQEHIAAGAPARADGRMHLVHYAAWLVQRVIEESK